MADFDPSKPSIARVYDYLLDGDWEQPVHLPPRAGQVIVGVARVG